MVGSSFPSLSTIILLFCLINFVTEQLSGKKETNFSDFLIQPTIQFMTIKWEKIMVWLSISLIESIIVLRHSSWGSSSSSIFALKILLNHSLLFERGMPGEGISAKVLSITSLFCIFFCNGFAVFIALNRGLEIAFRLWSNSVDISLTKILDCCLPVP